MFYFYKEDADQALKHFEHSLSLREDIGDKNKIFETLMGMTVVFYNLKQDFDQALKIAERRVNIAKETGNKKL
ncbi:MAG: tetratricopeptide repeat protein [Candidatus Hodarchaeota archaeon]